MMTTTLYVTLVNEDRGHIFEQFSETRDDDADLFRWLQRIYGRCKSKVYIDTITPGPPREVGWCFQKRVEYDDCPKTFLQEAWVTVTRGD